MIWNEKKKHWKRVMCSLGNHIRTKLWIYPIWMNINPIDYNRQNREFATNSQIEIKGFASTKPTFPHRARALEASSSVIHVAWVNFSSKIILTLTWYIFTVFLMGMLLWNTRFLQTKRIIQRLRLTFGKIQILFQRKSC